MMQARCSEIWRDQALKLTVQDERGLTLFVLEMTAMVAPAVSESLLRRSAQTRSGG